MEATASSDILIFSAFAILRSRSAISSGEIGFRSKRWHRDRIVGRTFCTSVVANTNLTCAGGSSRVFRSALKADADSMCTSSMM
jgi:hypothetical protein